jgi:hypothetical protein
MGKHVNSNVKRAEAAGLNTKVNKKVFDAFKDCCAYTGFPMNMVLESFMKQYSNGRFKLDDHDIMKFKNDGKPVGTLNTTINKDVRTQFVIACRKNDYFVKHVLSAFMEQFASGQLVMEFVNANDIKK